MVQRGYSEARIDKFWEEIFCVFFAGHLKSLSATTPCEDVYQNLLVIRQAVPRVPSKDLYSKEQL